MELIVKDMSLPEAIDFNYEEIKAELTEKVSYYKGLVYTDDGISKAKSDLANLRKFTKALSDERIKVKKQCLAPYEEFERKINDLVALVNEPIGLISQQVNNYEEQLKANKKAEIEKLWEDKRTYEWLSLSMIWNDKWLNATVKFPAIEKEIAEKLDQIDKDIITISALPEFSFEAQKVYETTLDLNKAISEGMRLSEIQKQKEEFERKKKEEEVKAAINPPEPEVVAEVAAVPVEEPAPTTTPSEDKIYTLQFEITCNLDQAKALRKFFDETGIAFKQIGGGMK